MKKIFFTFLLFGSTFLYAQTRTKPYASSSMDETLSTIEGEVLQAKNIRDIMEGDEVVLDDIPSDLKKYQRLSLQGMSNNKQDLNHLIEGAYTAVDLIKEVLEESMEYRMGERIPFLLERIPEIIQSSGDRSGEMLLRFTLYRCQDLMGQLLSISGYNYEEIGRWASNFIKEHLKLAAGLGNNNFAITSIFYQETPNPKVQIIHTAEYGRIYSQVLWDFSTGLTSNASKAVMLMKLLNFLGRDLNNDLRRRETPIAQSIRDVFRAQHGPEYQRVLQQLKLGLNPTDSMLAALRSKVERVRMNLNQRLGARTDCQEKR